jgi:hypothetical protein
LRDLCEFAFIVPLDVYLRVAVILALINKNARRLIQLLAKERLLRLKNYFHLEVFSTSMSMAWLLDEHEIFIIQKQAMFHVVAQPSNAYRAQYAPHR